MSLMSDWIDTLYMEWRKKQNGYMIIDGLETANPSIIAKGALLMDKQKMESCPKCFNMLGSIML